VHTDNEAIRKAVYRVRSLCNEAPQAIPGFVTPLAALSDIQAAILYYEGAVDAADRKAAEKLEKAERAKARRNNKKVRLLAVTFPSPRAYSIMLFFRQPNQLSSSLSLRKGPRTRRVCRLKSALSLPSLTRYFIQCFAGSFANLSLSRWMSTMVLRPTLLPRRPRLALVPSLRE
jgi:hypothetical protein